MVVENIEGVYMIQCAPAQEGNILCNLFDENYKTIKQVRGLQLIKFENPTDVEIEKGLQTITFEKDNPRTALVRGDIVKTLKVWDR